MFWPVSLIETHFKRLVTYGRERVMSNVLHCTIHGPSSSRWCRHIARVSPPPHLCVWNRLLTHRTINRKILSPSAHRLSTGKSLTKRQIPSSLMHLDVSPSVSLLYRWNNFDSSFRYLHGICRSWVGRSKEWRIKKSCFVRLTICRPEALLYYFATPNHAANRDVLLHGCCYQPDEQSNQGRNHQYSRICYFVCPYTKGLASSVAIAVCSFAHTSKYTNTYTSLTALHSLTIPLT